MSKTDLKKSSFIALFILQFVGTGVWLPTHVDVYPFFWPSKAHVSEHTDRGPCRDVPLSRIDYCPLCAASQSRVSFKPVYSLPAGFHVVGLVEEFFLVTPSQQLHLDSFSRRGPPSSLA
jgi:hypothetical protein